MTKDEISAATDRQLNEWAAAKVLGLEASEWYDAVTTSDRPMMKIDSIDRVIASEPYLFGTMTEYSHQWHLYTPTTDIEQATALLDHLAKQGFWSYVFTKTQPDLHYKVQIGKHHEEGFCIDKSRTRAIVIAALMVVELTA